MRLTSIVSVVFLFISLAMVVQIAALAGTLTDQLPIAMEISAI
jgi:hypothetical protein